MANTRFLFVYGTLMSTATSAMGRRPRSKLTQMSRVVGPAAIAGQLYDLGAYPGLVLNCAKTGPSTTVTGELRELISPATAFGWLDRYEGIDPRYPQKTEYRRSIEEVELLQDDAHTVRHEAWVYIYQGPLVRARLIPDGRWPH
jgi:gamma-glutamylcyclotransferase (GGCT)/AIG2-like uncharacterized protein YtfP